MTQISDLIEATMSAVVRVEGISNNRRVPLGTGFFCEEGFVTCHHVIYQDNLGLEGYSLQTQSQDEPERLLGNNALLGTISKKSAATDADFVIADISPPKGVLPLSLSDEEPRMGDEVVFIGFPFGAKHITAHVGYVSGIFSDRGTQVIQIDGSVNGGNSGGPVIDVETSKVIGFITQANVGFIANQFDELLGVLQQNIHDLSKVQSGGVFLSGVDPVQGLKATMGAMFQIAFNLKRSANVGIGYAHKAKHLKT